MTTVSGPDPSAPRLLDQVREVIRIRHYSIRTEQAYLQWIRRFILFHQKRHPREMGAPELTAFLSHLATQRNVAASTQNQALHAILFLCREVLKISLHGSTRCSGPRNHSIYLSCSLERKSKHCWHSFRVRFG